MQPASWKTRTMTVIYTIPVPFQGDDLIEVYGQPDMGWYEWRVITPNGKILHDSKNMGYGSPGIALRDALIELTR